MHHFLQWLLIALNAIEVVCIWYVIYKLGGFKATAEKLEKLFEEGKEE